MTESGQSADTLRPSATRIVDSVDDVSADWLTDARFSAGFYLVGLAGASQ
jgi:hypothetical protein